MTAALASGVPADKLAADVIARETLGDLAAAQSVVGTLCWRISQVRCQAEQDNERAELGRRLKDDQAAGEADSQAANAFGRSCVHSHGRDVEAAAAELAQSYGDNEALLAVARSAYEQGLEPLRAKSDSEAVSAALDDAALVAAVEGLSVAYPSMRGRRVFLERQLVSWARAMHQDNPATPLAETLRQALVAGDFKSANGSGGLAPLPPPVAGPPDQPLAERVAEVLSR